MRADIIAARSLNMEWVYNNTSGMEYKRDNICDHEKQRIVQPEMKKSFIPVRKSMSAGLSSPRIPSNDKPKQVHHNGRIENENIYEEPGPTIKPRLTSTNCHPAFRNMSANNFNLSERTYTQNELERKPDNHCEYIKSITNVSNNITKNGCQNGYGQVYSSGQTIADNILANKRSMIPTLANNLKPPCNSRTSQHSVERIQSRPLPIPEASRRRPNQQTCQIPARFNGSNLSRRGTKDSPSASAPATEFKSSRQVLYNEASRGNSVRKAIPIYPSPKFVHKRECSSNDFHSNNVPPSHTEECSDNTLINSPREKNLKRGFMWCLHDGMFARWKERFVILTKESLKIYKKTTSKHQDFGNLLFDISLTSVTSMSLEDRRGYLTIALYCQDKQHGKLVLRRTDGIREWFSVLQNIHRRCKERLESEGSMLSTAEFWDKRHFSDLGCEPLRGSWRRPTPAPWEQDSGLGSITTATHSDTSSVSSRHLRTTSPQLYSPQRQLRMVLK